MMPPPRLGLLGRRAFAAAATATQPMPVLAVRAPRQKRLFPGGDVFVQRPFPPALSARESSPFLFCDIIGPTASQGSLTGDAFPTPWHPHCGHDVLTYLTAGVGRHADSLGNRGTYAAPGLQWISVGSGVEHAEGGGTPLGETESGFQLWINVPAAQKGAAPRYGHARSEDIPELSRPHGARLRVLGGVFEGAVGPFSTAQRILILDVVLQPGGALDLDVAPVSLNTVLCLAHGGGRLDEAVEDGGEGIVSVNGTALRLRDTAVLDASGAGGPRGLSLCAPAGGSGASVLILAGERIDEPLAWRGTFTLPTEAALAATERLAADASSFPPVRAPWDYKRLSTFPLGHPARLTCGEGEVA